MSESISSIKGQLAHYVRQGVKPYNEDAASSTTFFSDKPNAPAYVHTLIVADGHGSNGEGQPCAEFCVSEANRWVQTLLSSDEDWKTIDWSTKLKELTIHLHDSFRTILQSRKTGRVIKNGIVYEKTGYSLDAVHSGSTFSMTLTFPISNIANNQGNQFRTVAVQVGDSDIYITNERVNVDHSPLNPEEWKRIQTFPEGSRGICVFDTLGKTLHVYSPDGTYNPKFYNASKPNAPWRWTDEQGLATGLNPNCAKYTPGSYLTAEGMRLACTRSIGDYYGHVSGLTCEGEVFVKDTVECPFITIGSDGAFDTINAKDKWVFNRGTKLDVHITMEQGDTLERLVSNRVNALYELYCEKFGRRNIDDISLACLHP
jgi:serine/threonine protein phosphatase PrpC